MLMPLNGEYACILRELGLAELKRRIDSISIDISRGRVARHAGTKLGRCPTLR